MNGERSSLREALPRLVCPEGHAWVTAFPASLTGAPCPSCGKPVERQEREPDELQVALWWKS